MKSMKVFTLAVLLATAAVGAQAQRAAGSQQTSQTPGAQVGGETDGDAPRATAPQSFKAEYLGGIFGYNRKQNGTLSFDDGSRRLVFRDKSNKELFSIPYDTIAATYGDTQKRITKGGQIATQIPTPFFVGQLGHLFRTKRSYLNLQYNDSDTDVVGETSFKLDDRKLLDSAVASVAAKAGLIRRGEIFVRRRDAATNANAL